MDCFASLAVTGSNSSIDALTALAKNDADKLLVMTCLGRLVADGIGAWEMRDNGEVELRLDSGETYLLAETSIVRIA